MVMNEIQKELLRLEYPLLQPDYDPDIERYFYLRSNGQARNALHIFETRLKPRYPDDRLRTALFTTYRNHDPVHRQLLAVAYRALVARSMEQIRRSIVYIAAKIEDYDKRDVYRTIKTAENILRLFPSGHYEAIEGIERLSHYSQEMNFHVRAMENAVELVRSYLTQSLPIVQNELQRRDRVRRRTARTRREQFLAGMEGRGGASTGISAVVFSPAELNRIEIPPGLTRLEDQTIAYCLKYWNMVRDPAFERILFLYSRKYGKKNHDIYLIIRQGRALRRRDDEILASVMSSLVTGYYYSVLGDRYLQRRWMAVKDEAALPLSPRQARAAARAVIVSAGSGGTKKAAGKSGKAKKNAAMVKKAAERGAAVPKTAPQKPIVRRTAAGKPPPVSGKRKIAPTPKAGIMQAAGHSAAGGSVSDRLRALSGRSYDLYQERFLTRARPAIRKILGARRGIFFSLPEAAENLVYNFLRDHYADPYMNWAESAEKTALARLGFALESLNPVIDECFKAVRD
jgi:hypothetical protein